MKTLYVLTHLIFYSSSR